MGINEAHTVCLPWSAYFSETLRKQGFPHPAPSGGKTSHGPEANGFAAPEMGEGRSWPQGPQSPVSWDKGKVDHCSYTESREGVKTSSE